MRILISRLHVKSERGRIFPCAEYYNRAGMKGFNIFKHRPAYALTTECGLYCQIFHFIPALSLTCDSTYGDYTIVNKSGIKLRPVNITAYHGSDSSPTRSNGMYPSLSHSLTMLIIMSLLHVSVNIKKLSVRARLLGMVISEATLLGYTTRLAVGFIKGNPHVFLAKHSAGI